jgi:hypothetical protein
VSPVPGLDALGPGLGLLVGGALLALVLWLGWRKPTWALIVALASLSIRPELLWGGPALGIGWSLHHTLIMFALVINGLRHGIRRSVNWPILALAAAFILSLAFGMMHPKLTLPLMLMSLTILALPFLFTQVVFAPGSRRACGSVIASVPALNVIAGVVLHLEHGLPELDPTGYVAFHRMNGAAGDAGLLAILAFAGFVVALHESTRPGRPYAGLLAAVNATIVILTGTRMAMLACAFFLATYAVRSEALRGLWRRQMVRIVLTTACLGGALALALPTALDRSAFGTEQAFQMSGRDVVWSFYLDELQTSPFFGRGFGVGLIAGEDSIPFPRTTTHSVHIDLLTTGGLVGFVLCVAAIGLWYRRLLESAAPHDRDFLIALLPALALFALTEDLLIFPGGLALFAYLGTLLTRSAGVALASRTPLAQPGAAKT